MKDATQERLKTLFPNGQPKWVRVYDNEGKTADRFTIVFTGRFKKQDRPYLSMDENPNSPNGVCMWGSAPLTDPVLDCDNGWPPKIGSKHNLLGTRIHFKDLPSKCKDAVITAYAILWEFVPTQALLYCNTVQGYKQR